jgi:hypothetical protein
MLDVELLGDRGVLVLKPAGALEASDFERAAAIVDPVIARDGRLAGVLIHARRFPGWKDVAALRSHLRFVRDRHRRIARLAVATDGAVARFLPAIAGLFVAPEVRRFPFDGKDEALRWLEGAAASRR